MRKEPECPQVEANEAAKDDDTDSWLRALQDELGFPDREFRLYVRYLRALALLCECAPYVDEEEYVGLIDELLADACAHYPLEFRRDERWREIAPRTRGPARAEAPGRTS